MVFLPTRILPALQELNESLHKFILTYSFSYNWFSTHSVMVKFEKVKKYTKILKAATFRGIRGKPLRYITMITYIYTAYFIWLVWLTRAYFPVLRIRIFFDFSKCSYIFWIFRSTCALYCIVETADVSTTFIS